MNVNEPNPYESSAVVAEAPLSSVASVITLVSLSICIGLLFVAVMLLPFAWLLRDGLGPDAVESSGFGAVQKMFWCFYWGPATLAITIVVVLLTVTNRSLGRSED